MKPLWKPTIGSFSKAVEGSVSLNFAESGGENCDPSCSAFVLKICYAMHTEKVKPCIAVSGKRKRLAGFAACCLEYAAQIKRKVAKGESIPWLRFSTFGSVPNRPLSAGEVSAFVTLVRSFLDGTPVHFPVETADKARRFRSIAAIHNLPLVVRESCQTDARAAECLAQGLPSSRIAYHGRNKRERLANAMLSAKGTGAAVCPAIASTILKRNRIKCGQCTLCAQSSRIQIIYPQH